MYEDDEPASRGGRLKQLALWLGIVAVMVAVAFVVMRFVSARSLR